MPKKPTFPSSDEAELSQGSGSESEAQLKKAVPKKKENKGKPKQKAKAKARDLSESGDEQHVPKKRKLEKPVKKASKAGKDAVPGTSDIKMSDEGDSYIDLGKRKRATVRSFKGSNLLLDIREFYEDRTTGQEKPGKKGITLSLEQWETLKDNVHSIDRLFGEL